VFAASVAAGQPSLVVIGVLASAVAAFFYLRVIALMFLEEPREWVGRPAGVDASSGLVALVAALVVAAVGIVPQPLLELARNATFLSR
jgi:NADH-quinone oxidoreductase subunit N